MPSFARTARGDSPSRTPPSDRPGTRTPAFGRPAAAGTANASAIKMVANRLRLICSQYVALESRGRPRVAGRSLRAEAPRVGDAVGLDPRHDDSRSLGAGREGPGRGRDVRSRAARQRAGRADARGDLEL